MSVLLVCLLPMYTVILHAMLTLGWPNVRFGPLTARMLLNLKGLISNLVLNYSEEKQY